MALSIRDENGNIKPWVMIGGAVASIAGLAFIVMGRGSTDSSVPNTTDVPDATSADLISQLQQLIKELQSKGDGGDDGDGGDGGGDGKVVIPGPSPLPFVGGTGVLAGGSGGSVTGTTGPGIWRDPFVPEPGPLPFIRSLNQLGVGSKLSTDVRVTSSSPTISESTTATTYQRIAKFNPLGLFKGTSNIPSSVGSMPSSNPTNPIR